MKRKDTGKPARSAAPRSRSGGSAADPYQKARRPRAAAGEAPPFARRPRPASGDSPTFARRPGQSSGDGPPFARRPRAAPGEAPAFAREHRPPPRRPPGEAGFAGREGGRPEGGGFTVTLDPDVAKVFRGDASVNKALRLVLQLMQVVQGPPRSFGPRSDQPRRGYEGSAEARGFTRKPRFEDDEQ